jgi:hypothetical protein
VRRQHIKTRAYSEEVAHFTVARKQKRERERNWSLCIPFRGILPMTELSARDPTSEKVPSPLDSATS